MFTKRKWHRVPGSGSCNIQLHLSSGETRSCFSVTCNKIIEQPSLLSVIWNIVCSCGKKKPSQAKPNRQGYIQHRSSDLIWHTIRGILHCSSLKSLCSEWLKKATTITAVSLIVSTQKEKKKRKKPKTILRHCFKKWKEENFTGIRSEHNTKEMLLT